MTDILDLIVPFQGFYESAHSDNIEHYAVSLVDEGDFNDEFYENTNFTELHAEYSKTFVDLLAQELDLTSLSFKSLHSPKEYNFSTDVIVATIGKNDILSMYEIAKHNGLKELIELKLKPRSGFIPFYDNSLLVWLTKQPDITLWDDNQLGFILEAFIAYTLDNDYELYISYDIDVGESL